MFERKPSFTQVSVFITGILILLIALSIPSTAYADDPTPVPPNNGNCITCHEDLYFLHDTGNWFCLEESPMTCVGCHGGDPTATTKELAHINRAPHPVLNDDVSKCQQCHPEQCDERVALFDQTAGIGEILVAVHYTPANSTGISKTFPASEQKAKKSGSWLNLMEIISVILVGSIALAIYFYFRVRHASKGKS